jgi:hypothetical protein
MGGGAALLWGLTNLIVLSNGKKNSKNSIPSICPPLPLPHFFGFILLEFAGGSVTVESQKRGK